MSGNRVILFPLQPGLCSYFNDGRKSQHVRVLPSEEHGLNDMITSPAARTRIIFGGASMGLLTRSIGNVATNCENCRACVPLRVNTSKFSMSPSQEKLMAKTNLDFSFVETQDLDIFLMYALFRKYAKARHDQSKIENSKEKGMADWSLDDFANWIAEVPLVLVAMKGSRLIGFSLIDGDETNMNLLYSAFDPSASKMSPGKQLWIATIQQAIEMDIDHVYVGEWAKDSPKLDYKRLHSGLETCVFDPRTRQWQWVDFDPEIHTQGPDYQAMTKADEFHF